jgi:hypothetical protein
LDFSILDFWQWAASDLVGNTNRGLLAEYIARWAKYRASNQKTGVAKSTRVFTAAARRKMAAAQKARWDAYRAKKTKNAA